MFPVCYHKFFVLRVTALSLFRFLWGLFICYNSFLVIHLLLWLISNDYYKILYIYICFSRATNRRSSTETKLKIMQLNIYLILMSQATYVLKELQFEWKHTHMVESSRIQMIYFAVKGLRGVVLFNSCYFILLWYICKH